MPDTDDTEEAKVIQGSFRAWQLVPDDLLKHAAATMQKTRVALPRRPASTLLSHCAANKCHNGSDSIQSGVCQRPRISSLRIDGLDLAKPRTPSAPPTPALRSSMALNLFDTTSSSPLTPPLRYSMASSLLEGNLETFMSTNEKLTSIRSRRAESDADQTEDVIAKKLFHVSEVNATWGPKEARDNFVEKRSCTTGTLTRSPLALSALCVICGCACQAPFELMNTRDRGCGDLVAVTEYVFSVLASLPGALHARHAHGRWKIPWRLHFLVAGSDLCYTICLNLALATRLPMPVLITMKNGNLVANLLVGFVIQQRRYNAFQILAVLVVTVGLILTTLTSRVASGANAPDDSSDVFTGVGFLSVALFMRAVAGVFQERSMKCCNNTAVAEALLWRSALGLPFFLTKACNIQAHWRIWNSMDAAGEAYLPMWVLLAANLIFSYLMKISITRLIGATSALSATMVLTFQRFVSFIISALVLNPESGLGLWIGSAAVLFGTLAYSRVTDQPSTTAFAAKKEKDL